jgi:hypothetical protein
MKWLVLAWFFRKEIREGWRKSDPHVAFAQAAGRPMLTLNEARAKLSLLPPFTEEAIKLYKPRKRFWQRSRSTA